MTLWKIFYDVTIKKKATEQNLPVVIFITVVKQRRGRGQREWQKGPRSTKQQLHTYITLFDILSPSLQIYDVKLPNSPFMEYVKTIKQIFRLLHL